MDNNILKSLTNTHSHALTLVDCGTPSKSQWNLESLTKAKTISWPTNRYNWHKHKIFVDKRWTLLPGKPHKHNIRKWCRMVSGSATIFVDNVPTAPLYNPHSAFKFTTHITFLSRQRYRSGMSPLALLLSAFCAWRPLSAAFNFATG